MESVTTSEQRAKSMPDASDIFRTDGRAAMEVSTSHPARLIYSRALADSVAVLEVVLPISIAAASNFAYSSVLALAVAAAEDIAASNSRPVLIEATPIPASPAPMPLIAAAAIFMLSPPTLPKAPRASRLFCAPETADVKDLSRFPAILIAI